MADLEGVDDMVDLRRTGGGEGDGDDIEAGRGVPVSLAEEILLRCPADLHLLASGDGLGGEVGSCGSAGLHLYEDQGCTVLGDNVDLATLLPEIPGQDGVVQGFEVANGQVLTVFAKLDALFRQIPSPP